MQQLTRFVVASTLTLAAAAGGVSAPAWAGEDTGMCNEDHTRVQIPGDFPIKACFDGKTLSLLNDSEIPVAITLTGSNVGTPQRSSQGDGGAARAMVFIRPGDFTPQPQINGPDYRSGMVPPGDYLKTDVGNSEVKVDLAEPDASFQRNYLVTEALWRYLPLSGGAEVAKVVADMISELAKTGDEYIRCLDRNQAWGKIGCTLLEQRNITFAIGRAIFKGAAKELFKAATDLFDAGKWAAKIHESHGSLKSGTRSFKIAAYTPPAPPTTPPAPPQPSQPPAGNGDTGGTSGGGNSGGGGNTNPQPQTITAVVQNKHLEGPDGLAEDSTPSYLSGQMVARCAANGCKIGDTDMGSGDTFTGSCWSTGAVITNENRSTDADDNNPNRIETDRWLYGTRNGHGGYISYVYVTKDTRDQADKLSHC